MDPNRCFAPDLLTGKTALVTGGATGIGLAITKGLARAGCDVVIASRKLDVVNGVADDVARTTGRTITALQVDIRDLDSVASLRDDIAARHGQVDILVNNAGGQFPQPAAEYSPKGWRTIIDLNLNGTWNVTQAIGTQMLEGRGGNICSIVMTTGRGNPGIAHSGAARAAIGELTRSLSYEWGPKVRVNCVGPGAVVTPGFEATYDEDVLADNQDTPLPHPGTTTDIANAVVFLVSPAGRFITGETLMVDGGVSRYGSNQALPGASFPHRAELGPDW